MVPSSARNNHRSSLGSPVGIVAIVAVCGMAVVGAAGIVAEVVAVLGALEMRVGEPQGWSLAVVAC